jgi:hypothetical protein
MFGLNPREQHRQVSLTRHEDLHSYVPVCCKISKNFYNKSEQNPFILIGVVAAFEVIDMANF